MECSDHRRAAVRVAPRTERINNGTPSHSIKRLRSDAVQARMLRISGKGRVLTESSSAAITHNECRNRSRKTQQCQTATQHRVHVGREIFYSNRIAHRLPSMKLRVPP